MTEGILVMKDGVHGTVDIVKDFAQWSKEELFPSG